MAFISLKPSHPPPPPTPPHTTLCASSPLTLALSFPTTHISHCAYCTPTSLRAPSTSRLNGTAHSLPGHHCPSFHLLWAVCAPRLWIPRLWHVPGGLLREVGPDSLLPFATYKAPPSACEKSQPLHSSHHSAQSSLSPHCCCLLSSDPGLPGLWPGLPGPLSTIPASTSGQNPPQTHPLITQAPGCRLPHPPDTLLPPPAPPVTHSLGHTWMSTSPPNALSSVLVSDHRISHPHCDPISHHRNL